MVIDVCTTEMDKPVTVRPLSPFSVNLILGRSGAGKTVLLNKILANFESLYMCKISKFVLVYNTWDDVYQNMIDRLGPEIPVTLFQGLDEQVFHSKTLANEEGTTVLVIDDCLRQFMSRTFETQMAQLAAVDARHKRITVFILLQSDSFRNVLSNVWSNTRYIYYL
ncbi:MAG: ATP-binding protein [Gammaproteobacteria bacterium]|nr:ATP-binding protein [Gammaproteobacteria bacterium]